MNEKEVEKMSEQELEEFFERKRAYKEVIINQISAYLDKYLQRLPSPCFINQLYWIGKGRIVIEVNKDFFIMKIREKNDYVRIWEPHVDFDIEYFERWGGTNISFYNEGVLSVLFDNIIIEQGETSLHPIKITVIRKLEE